jgi:hypothetical protein
MYNHDRVVTFSELFSLIVCSNFVTIRGSLFDTLRIERGVKKVKYKEIACTCGHRVKIGLTISITIFYGGRDCRPR